MTKLISVEPQSEEDDGEINFFTGEGLDADTVENILQSLLSYVQMVDPYDE
jgi:hypothetical protein